MNVSVTLRQLSVSDGLPVYEMLQTISCNENEFHNPVNGLSFSEFKDWLIEQDGWSRGEGLPSGYVGQTVFWLYDGDIPVGIGKIRHKLTEKSRKSGGNIGYAISSKYRGRGYGTALLRLLTQKATEMKIEEQLLTVLKTNIASCCAILKAGGRVINENENWWFFAF